MAESPVTLKITSATSTAGLYYKLDPAAVVDNVLSFLDSNGTKIQIVNAKGPYKLRLGGVVPGSNMLSRIQTIINDTRIKSVVFDDGDITITGTLNCNGKKIIFRNGSKLIGTHTLDSGILDCDLSSQCFSTTTTLTNFKSVRAEFSFENYGAVGNNGNDTVAMQKTVDTLIANTGMPATIKVFRGKIYGTNGLILHKWDGTNYGQFAINIIGESSAFGGQGVLPTIKGLNPNGFAINIQRAVGATIKGINVVGPANVTNVSSLGEFYSRPYATFSNGRASKNSPLTGIVLDAFSNTVFVPDDGGYPDYNGTATAINPSGTNWYRGATGSENSGCTAVTLHDITINGFTAGICVSPNGLTQQCENLRFSDIYAYSLQCVFSFCQRESKNCKITGGYTIDRVHTVIDGLTYGGYGGPAGSGTVPDFDGWNQAGSVVRFINATAQHSVTFNKIYMENFYQIGNMTNQYAAVSFTNCTFAFNAIPPVLNAPSHFFGLNVKFDTCQLRFYDDQYNKRLGIEGQGIQFDNCYFDQPPLTTIGMDIGGTTKGVSSTFKNCRYGPSGNYYIGVAEFRGIQDTSTALPYGYMFSDNYHDEELGTTGGKFTTEIRCGNYENVKSFGTITWVVNAAAHTATVATGGGPTDDINPGMYIFYQDGSGNGRVLGRVATRVSAYSYTLVDVPLGIANGAGSSTGMFVVDYNRIKGRFVGDYTNNSNVITNIKGTPTVGERDVFSKHLIDSFDPSTFQAVLRGTYIGPTMTEIYSGPLESGTYQATYYAYALPIDTIYNDLSHVANLRIYYPGDIWELVPYYIGYSNDFGHRRFRCIRAGILFPALYSLNDTWKCLFEEIYDTYIKKTVVLSANGSLPIPRMTGVNGYDFRATAGMTINVGTTPGGSEIINALVLTSGVTESVSSRKYFDVDGVIYITGVSGGTLTMKVF